MTGSWRDAILKEFVPNVSRLTLVADPDGLLTEEKLARELRTRGFDLIEFTDPIEFRYAYESNYRSIWDKGEHTDLVVILRIQDNELESLPYDLLQAGRKLTFNLGELFPGLSYPVIETLDRSLLDPLFRAQKSLEDSERRGDNATRDFVLHHVFSIAVGMITNHVELLRVLLKLHYGKTKLPDTLAERLAFQLGTRNIFHGWALETIISDDQAFFKFLQERWPLFLESQTRTLPGKDSVKEGAPDFSYPGPGILPFSHDDIRVYIDNLFVEGKLHPVPPPRQGIPESSSWLLCGILDNREENARIRIDRLFGLMDEMVPETDARFSAWIQCGMKWAELCALIHEGNSNEDVVRLEEVGSRLNSVFAGWLEANYASLASLPVTQSAMVHHLPKRLSLDMEAGGKERIALVVMDGLALDQWVTIREILQKQDDRLLMRESATFAWIPTLTSISRQAIFAGKPPQSFPSSIKTTNNEAKLWQKFWEDFGLSRLDIAYMRGLGDDDLIDALESKINPDRIRALGLVVDTIDKIMHGMQLGAAGMHNQIRLWCQSGYLTRLFGYLLDNGFDVWVTSDHGNIECQGKGRPQEGVIAEVRGERVRIYPSPELRSRIAGQFPFAHAWEPIGLPPEFFPLIATGRDAFVNPGGSIVCHGGIALEEVIVPLIKIERK